MPATQTDPRVLRAERITAPFADLFPFEPHFLEVDGGAVHYVDEGAREADPILCVHGNPSWSFLFRRLILEFSETQRVVAPDHMGCGLSDQPADWSYRLQDHVDNLERLVLELDLQRITLVVHDWGGAIGMGFAARHPERVARLVITNSAAFTGGAVPWRIALCRLPLVGRALVEGLNGFARAATVMAVERPLRGEVKRAWLAPYAAPRSARATHRFVEDIPTNPQHPSWATLTRIAAALPLFDDVPSLILWGMRDWCFTPEFLAEWKRRLPHAQCHTIEGAGHYLFEDAPQETLDTIRDFLDRAPPPRSTP